jgi:outer membrane protein
MTLLPILLMRLGPLERGFMNNRQAIFTNICRRRALKQLRLAVSCIALVAASQVLQSNVAVAESINDALAAAYRYNPRLDAARATLRATDESVAQQNAGYRPTLNGTADAGYSTVTTVPSVGSLGATSVGETHPRGYSVTASQPLFRGLRVLNGVREAEANVRAGRETLRTSEQSVLLEAATAYMDVVRDQAIVTLRENNVQVLSRELKATKDRFSVGEVTRTDVAQAEASRAAAVSALDLAKSNLQTSRGNYERTVGKPPSRLVEPKPVDKRLPRSLDDAVSISSRESPTVVAALYREQSARHTVDRTWGELLPTAQVDATYSKRLESSTTVASTDTTTVVGRVNVPFYTGGEVQARVRAAKQTHLARIQEIEQNRTEVKAAVVQSWSQLVASRAQLQSDQVQVASNRTALTGVREEEKVGQRTLLDVLTAEQTLLNAEVNLVTTKRNLVVFSYTLLQAVGRLNVQELGTNSEVYDAEVHYHEVRRKWWGIDITRNDGRREFIDLWKTHGERYDERGASVPVK